MQVFPRSQIGFDGKNVGEEAIWREHRFDGQVVDDLSAHVIESMRNDGMGCTSKFTVMIGRFQDLCQFQPVSGV